MFAARGVPWPVAGALTSPCERPGRGTIETFGGRASLTARRRWRIARSEASTWHEGNRSAELHAVSPRPELEAHEQRTRIHGERRPQLPSVSRDADPLPHSY